MGSLFWRSSPRLRSGVRSDSGRADGVKLEAAANAQGDVMSEPKYRTLETASMTKEELGRALMGREVRVTETVIYSNSTAQQSTTVFVGVVEGIREANGLPIADIAKPGRPSAGAYLRGADGDEHSSTIRVVVEVRMNARDQLNEALDAVDGASDSEEEAGAADDLVKLVRRLLAEGEL